MYCTYACLYVRTYLCIPSYALNRFRCMYAYMLFYVHVYICMYVCMHEWIQMCKNAWMSIIWFILIYFAPTLCFCRNVVLNPCNFRAIDICKFLRTVRSAALMLESRRPSAANSLSFLSWDINIVIIYLRHDIIIIFMYENPLLFCIACASHIYRMLENASNFVCFEFDFSLLFTFVALEVDEKALLEQYLQVMHWKGN